MDTFRGNFIEGQFVPSADGVVFGSRNPANDEPVLSGVRSSVAAVDAAVKAARAAAPGWRRLGLTGRIEALRKVQALVEAHRERIACAIVLCRKKET